jgi:hypothetical protein
LRSRIAECAEDADYAERSLSGLRGFSEISGSMDEATDRSRQGSSYPLISFRSAGRIDAFCGKGDIEMTEAMVLLEEHIPDYERIVDDAIHETLYSIQFLKEMPIGKAHSAPLYSESDGDFVYLIDIERGEKRDVSRITVKGGKSHRIETNPVQHIEWIPVTRFEDREYEKIKKALQDAGRGFAKEINRDVMLVLQKAASVQEADRMATLTALISEVADQFLETGCMADTLVIHRKLKHTLLDHDIVILEREHGKLHFVGHTKTGLNVFWSDELDEDSILMLDSTSAGTMVARDRQIGLWTGSQRPFHYKLDVYNDVNPVVQNCQSVRLIKNIEPLIKRLKGAYQMELIGQCFFTDQSEL